MRAKRSGSESGGNDESEGNDESGGETRRAKENEESGRNRGEWRNLLTPNFHHDSLFFVIIFFETF